MSTGHDPAFLGPPVPLPRPDPDRVLRVLPSTHFTVLLDPARRLALATTVDVDGSALRDVPRSDDWHLDPRVPADEQAGPALYAANDLDRGHLVRRRDPVWGTTAEAARAERETFAYPNAAPQAAAFNQSAALWNGLEDHVLDHALAHRLRLVVHTGTVLAPDDPVYRGVAVPRRFWKVVAWAARRPADGGTSPAEGGADGGAGPADAAPGALAATAFVLDQTASLGRIDLRAAPDDVPPLGPFRTFQVPVADVEALAAVDLGPLAAADVLAVVPAAAPPSPAVPGEQARAWRRLAAPGDVLLPAAARDARAPAPSGDG